MSKLAEHSPEEVKIPSRGTQIISSGKRSSIKNSIDASPPQDAHSKQQAVKPSQYFSFDKYVFFYTWVYGKLLKFKGPEYIPSEIFDHECCRSLINMEIICL